MKISSTFKTSVMASTTMPFLYQTRTLSSNRSIRLPITSTITFTLRRSFRTSRKLDAAGARKNIVSEGIPHIPVANVPNPYERTIEPPEGEAGNNIVIRKIAFDKTPKEKTFSGVGTIPFDEAGHDVEEMDFISSSDPFLADEDIFDQKYEDSGQLLSAQDRVGTQSTITMQERDAFRKIFADIQTYSRNSPGLPTNVSDYEAGRFKTKISSSSRDKKKTDAQESLLAVLEKAERATDPNRQAFGLKTQDKLFQEVERYPRPLRAAAAKALGLVQNKEELEEENTADVEHLEKLRQPERERVEALMREAKTDIELWRVMEKEVFSLPGKLGLVDDAANPAKIKKGRKKKSEAEETIQSKVAIVQDMKLSIHGPLYPSHLLLGLRLLDRSFTKPSPLHLNVLPRIKSLGLISHALGASTALYNELIRIFWIRYGNFRGIIDLLKEMEHVGLEVDDDTSNIVHEVNRLRAEIKLGRQGPVLHALWSTDEFSRLRFLKEWKARQAQHALGDQEADGPLRRIRPNHVFDESAFV